MLVLKRTPAEKAPMIATERWGHLDTPVAFNAIELVLVAHLAALQGLLAPQAGLDGRRGVGSEKLIALLPKSLTWWREPRYQG
jgi:hypothetical protein